MRKPTTRLFALVLCVLLLVSQLGLTDSVAVETEDPAEPVQTSEQVTPPELTEQSEPAEEPVADPVEEPASEPAEVPVAEVTEAPAPEVTEAPVPEVTEAPVAEVTEAPAPEVTEAPAPEITEAPAPEVTEAPAPEVTEAPVAEVTEAPAPEIPEAPAEEPVADEEPEPEIATIAGIMPMAREAVSLSAEPESVEAGTAITEITLTATGGTFAEDPGKTNFSIEGPGVAIESVDTAERQTDTNIVKLGVSNCTPTSQGTLTIQVNKEAFSPEQPTEDYLTATIEVSPAPDPTVTAKEVGGLKAGEKGQITLTITGDSNTFAGTLATENFTVKNGDETLTPSSVSGQGTSTATLSVTPVKSDNITIEIAKAAFKYQPSGDVNATGDLSVTAAEAPQVSAAPDTLRAGVSGGTITLTITGNNSFTNTDNSNYSVNGVDGLSVGSVSPEGAGNKAVNLTLAGTPTTGGKVSVTIQPSAFQYQPSEAVTVNDITVGAADTPTVTASSTDLFAGKAGGTITLKITSGGNNFGTDADKSKFTVEDLAVSAVDTQSGTDTATLTVTGTPTTAGKLNITIQPDAFQYQPEDAVTTTVDVAAPTGTLEAALVGDPLYAGTKVSGQTVTLTIKNGQGLTFKESPGNDAFTLDNGLSATAQKDNDTQVTLTLSGTPSKDGKVTITAVKGSAFTIAPENDLSAEITVNAAPTVTLTVNPETTTTGVELGTVTLTASGSSFATGVGSDKFELSGGPSSGLSVEVNSATGNTATLTITGKPTTAGALTITVPKEAFNPVAAANATVNITVQAVKGTVSAELEGSTLTAGTVVSGQKITLTAGGNLTFKNSGLTAEDFQLGEGHDSLSISNVSWTDETHVTLTLSGTPEKGGSFDVTVNTSAFTVEPTDGNAVKATPSIDIGYPTITLSATPEGGIYEDEAISEANNTITLTAQGGVFNITEQATNFSIDTATGLKLDSVSVKEGSTDTATLTLSGTPTKVGALTITVQPEAFKYQPETAVENKDISVQQPTGSITVTLVNGPDGPLYAGTPVNGQTITVSIAKGSHGLVFKPEQQAGYFTLTPEYGLKITNAAFDEASNTVTLTLEGTPSKAGDITVTATNDAFEYPPVKTETGTITINPAPTITLTVAPTTAVQGLDIKTITLTANGGTFANPATKDNFTLTGVEGLSVSTVAISNSGKTATLTVSGAPASTGTLTVTAKQAAFVIYPASDLTAEISVVALYGNISATLKGTLTAGADATGQSITLEITDTNGLTFAADVEAGAFTLGEGSADLTITDVTRGDDGLSVTLTLSGTPKAAGTFTVTAKRDSAFTVPPTAAGDVTATGDITIAYPTITVTAAPAKDIYEGDSIDNNLITITATGGVFSEVEGETENFSISDIEGIELVSVSAEDGATTATLTLSGVPEDAGTLTITVKPGAFKYKPKDNLTATVEVKSPTGTVTAELNGDPLYAGTPVNGQTVTLTIGESSHGLRFQDEAELDTSEFVLKGDAAAGLTIESVTRVSDTEVTLILGGTPKTAGEFEVDAEHTAFTYDPGMEESAGTFTVNPAPEITLTADPASVTAGLELGTVTITAENGTFLSQLGADLFTITSPDGIAEGLEITDVTVADDGTTVTLTVTGAPAKDGTLIITVDPTAFAIRPASGPEAKIAVAKLTGSVSMALAGGTLTAGTAADGLTLELEAAGEGLTFGADAAPGDFLLTGPGAEGLTVASVTRTDGTHVSLTLKGVPAKAGELGVTVKTTAFDVPPTDGQDVTAAPSVTVAYPTVSLTPAPASVSQGVAIDTITLTAAGGVFNAIDGGTDGFAISGVTGVTLVAVSAKDGGDTATLTITGAPEQAGTLTVTVQPEAFKYQPEKAVTAAITVTGPTGTVAAALSDALYAYTPVAGQTITITISDSKGLSFKDGLTPDSFQLTGPAAEGLTVAGVTGSGSAVTLTLSGTPAAGSFTVTVLENAFTFDPGKDMDAGSVSVNPAPEVSVTAEPETITAGEAVGTITITAVGGTFASTADASLFALSGYGASGLTISAVTVDGSTATLTITGAPENAGTMTVTVSRAAFSPVAADDPTVEITVRAGSISTDVETGEGAPATSFGSTVDDLADAVLDPEEQALLAEGATVTITLQEEDISDSVGAADKAAAEAAAGSYAVGAYLDLSLFKSVNDKQSAVHETNKPIVIVISVPTNLQSANRVFAVVRVHDGAGTMLNDLDSNPNTITIATDRFSTYAIVYRDGSATTPTPAPPAPSASTTPTAPDTGDEAAPALWLGLLALCAGALVLAGGLLRRRSGTR